MKSTAQKLIIISFVLAVIATITVFIYLKSLKSQNELGKKTTVFVAVETIPPRTLIDKKMIKEVQIVDNSVFNDYINDISKIIGKYTKERIFKNEGFLSDKLIDDDGEELSLNIDSNHRAISISVTGDSGVSDLLKPEDYVDVITYIAEKKDGAKIVSPDIAKIILQNIKVLAVDKQISREGNIKDKATEKEKTLTNFLVTLSISSQDIEKLVLAESIGKLKLTLRPLNGESDIKTKGATLNQLSVNSDDNIINSNEEKNANNVSEDKAVSNESEKEKSYTVKEGDTLRKISKEFYGDESKYTLIKDANNIKQENLILIGEVIKIPILK